MNIVVRLDTTLYTRQCVCEAAETYSTLCVVNVREYPSGIVAEFCISEGEEKVIDEFLNDVLTRSIENYLLRNQADAPNSLPISRSLPS